MVRKSFRQDKRGDNKDNHQLDEPSAERRLWLWLSFGRKSARRRSVTPMRRQTFVPLAFVAVQDES